MADTYDRLIALLNDARAQYRIIDHEPEGQTEVVSRLRGHAIAAAVKCIVLIVKTGRKNTRFVLAVVSGDARVDMQRVRRLFNGATYVGFASTEAAEKLAGSVVGTVLPFAFHADLLLIVDPSLKEHPEIFFNAARLDRSVAIRTEDYFSLARPRVEKIAGE